MATRAWRDTVAPWAWLVLALAVAFFFLRAAFEKFVGDPAALEPFVEFGWPLWIVPVVAVSEVVGAVALIVPASRLFGGLLLALIMGVAAFTNIANGHPDYLWVNALLAVGSLVLAWQGGRHRHRST